MTPTRTIKRKEKEKVLRGKNEENSTQQLANLYSNVASTPSFSSKIRDFLRQYKPNSIFKSVRKNFPRRPIIAYYKNEIIMADTINYASYQKSNRNFKYIMVFIDVLSKKLHCEPLKSLKDFDSVIAIEKYLRILPDIPKFFVTDQGGEFCNRKANHLFQTKGIKHYSLKGKHKAAIAERVIRTLKSRLEKYFWQYKTRNWIDVLSQFVKNYNNTPHRSIGTTPNSVTEKNQNEIFKKLYPKLELKTKPRLQKGDLVRLLVRKPFFQKGYTQSWTTELYKISEAKSNSGVDYYN